MEFKDLKKAWNQMSADTKDRDELTDEKIRELLSTRTANLMERMDKNIRWGFAILSVVISLMIAWDFLMTSTGWSVEVPALMVPPWVTMLDRGINFLILVLFLVFVVRYQQTRRTCESGCSLRQALQKVIRVLVTYKRLFVLALVIFLLSSATGYIAGFYKGVHIQGTSGIYLPLTIILGVLTLLLFTGLLFLLLRWVFRRLYGNYLHQLQQTLKELDELD